MISTSKLCLVLVFAAVLGVEASPVFPDQDLQIQSNKKYQINPLLENEDAKLTAPQMIVKYGYPVEIHDVVTADGYILQVHRIPHGKNPQECEEQKVVWLQHGLLGDSSNWIMNIPEKALAYQLANACYDVWLGNARGNTYSKRHINGDISKADYWLFSWHEMGMYDVPAVLEYILSKTGVDSIYYVGHSMGTTMFWIAMSEYPELNSKIRVMSAFAPISYVEHMKSPISWLAPWADLLEDILQLLGAYEFLPTSDLMDFLGQTICNQQSPVQGICSNILFLVGGYNTDQLNKTLLPAILGHVPAGAATRAIIHYAQGVNSGLFRKFNHGKEKNRELYGQDTPPSYDLSKVTCPVALYWGENDWLGDKSDVYRMAEELPTLVRKYRVNHDKYNHLDFLWAKDNDVLINKPFMDFIKYF